MTPNVSHSCCQFDKLCEWEWQMNVKYAVSSKGGERARGHMSTAPGPLSPTHFIALCDWIEIRSFEQCCPWLLLTLPPDYYLIRNSLISSMERLVFVTTVNGTHCAEQVIAVEHPWFFFFVTYGTCLLNKLNMRREKFNSVSNAPLSGLNKFTLVKGIGWCKDVFRRCWRTGPDTKLSSKVLLWSTRPSFTPFCPEPIQKEAAAENWNLSGPGSKRWMFFIHGMQALSIPWTDRFWSTGSPAVGPRQVFDKGLPLLFNFFGRPDFKFLMFPFLLVFSDWF